MRVHKMQIYKIDEQNYFKKILRIKLYVTTKLNLYHRSIIILLNGLHESVFFLNDNTKLDMTFYMRLLDLLFG